ncbi:hypothetical protein Tco_0936720 [Tanacetum coccineum]|uniref:Uncharacterized protein n=1 Tax=Tanacetum coccineum TaxID=301880 RepID=A0ABQ5DC70_9ASTR
MPISQATDLLLWLRSLITGLALQKVPILWNCIGRIGIAYFLEAFGYKVNFIFCATTITTTSATILGAAAVYAKLLAIHEDKEVELLVSTAVISPESTITELQESATQQATTPNEQQIVIMEYLVKISKRCAFWSLNEDILKIYYSEDQYAVSIKEDTVYPCLHSPKTTKETRSIRRIQKKSIHHIEDILRMTKVIKGEFEKLEDLKVKDVSLTCDTSLEVFNNEFNRLSGMDDDLFTYEVEVANILCDSNKDDDSEQRMSHEADDDMGYDPSDIRGDDEVELTDEEFSDNEDEVAEVFRIDTNIFDFETPMCKTFKEFNYLL